jgi:hypothetical protein
MRSTGVIMHMGLAVRNAIESERDTAERLAPVRGAA